MNILRVDKRYFSNEFDKYFVDIVHKNFIDLANYPELMHTHQDIYKLLLSSTMYSYIIINNNQLIGYMLGDIMHLNDSRNVYYISYIYISESHRGKQLGNKLLQCADKVVNKKKLDGIMLIADSYDKKVYSWYNRKGFTPDNVLRRGTQHEVLFRK